MRRNKKKKLTKYEKKEMVKKKGKLRKSKEPVKKKRNYKSEK